MLNNVISNPIGVFDSGLGGLSVLHSLLNLMPNENYVYYGDSSNAPYGIRSINEVYKLSKDIMEKLVYKYHVKAVVIACNTATSAAQKQLCNEYNLPIIGIEPAIKPAIIENPNQKIIVMATNLTLKGDKLNNLILRYDHYHNIIKVPAPNLVEYVENGDLNSLEVYNYLHSILDYYANNSIKGIVLGCTHFPFLKKAIYDVIGNNIKFYDGSEGTANYLKTKLMESGMLNTQTNIGDIKIYNSDLNKIPLSKKLISMSI